MNEVTQIHLGRQAFTISVAAHRELRTYLDAISKQVGDADVTDEVELRMAELLIEHGVTGDKVVLPADIDYLKQQLGDPKEFGESEDAAPSATKATSDRRLFRDPQNAWVAGVAAGIGAYFGIDVLLVRIVFILGTFAWGGSILVYIALWLLVPEAKSSSDRLQMAGKPVTVDSLKEVVERADVKGAARRTSDTLGGPAAQARDIVNTIFRLVVKIIGVGMVLFGLMLLVTLAFGGTYLLVHGNIIAGNLFPVDYREHLLVYLVTFLGVMVSLFIVLFGMAIFRRKWPIHAWLTGVLAGLTIIVMVGAGALAADTAPKVRDRYNAHLQTTVRQLPAFTSIATQGDGVTVNFNTSDTYSVSLKYFEGADATAVKTTVQNGVLTIDSSSFDWHRNCSRICIPDTYDMVVTVNSPNVPTTSYPVRVPTFQSRN